MGLTVGDTESIWLERELIERGAFLDEDLITAGYDAEREVEFSENIWPDAELAEAEAFTGGETFTGDGQLPAAYEMMDFLESDWPAMFVSVGGRNYLVRREDGVYGTGA